MSYAIGVIVLVVGLLLSIALHEIGHMVPAKKFGVRVSQYMVGFGPTLWSRTKGETEYGVKAIPLGGYVRLIGMYPPEAPDAKPRHGRIAELIRAARAASADEILPGEDHRAFYRLSAPKKLVVMLGGPVMNLIIACVLLTITQVGFGSLVPSTALLNVAPCLIPATAPASVDCDGLPASPAAAAGILPGDVVTAVGGTATPDWDSVVEAFGANGTAPTVVTVERDGAVLTLDVTPRVTTRAALASDGSATTEEAPVIGITPGYEFQSDGWAAVPDMVWYQLSETGKIVATLPARVVDVSKAAFGNAPRDQTSIIGVVGVGRLAGEVAAFDPAGVPSSVHVVSMLQLLASLNIALFVFNLIPLVPLDGGHVVGGLYEGLKRQVARVRRRPRPAPADTARMVPVAYGVFAVLSIMGLLLIYADIVKPVQIL